MSFAWATIALLVFLLPGFLFFIGLYLPEQFTRETVPRNVLGQLAGTVFVSFFIHALFYTTIGALCTKVPLPCIRTDYVLAVFQLDGSAVVPLSQLGGNLRAYPLSISLYVLLTTASGMAAGAFTGHGIIERRWFFRSLAQHGWVYDLAVGKRQGVFTYAYVLTDVQTTNRVLMYRGDLESFALTHQGQFSYLVLSNVMRYYMHLGPGAPETTKLIPIGQSATAGRRAMESSYLVIEGEDVANVVFERYETVVEDEGLDALQRALEHTRKKEKGVGQE